MESDEFIRRKSLEDLEKQTGEITKVLGEEIAPPFQVEETMKMSAEELKERFPRRYEIYLKNLRAEKRSQPLTDSEKSGMAMCLNTLNSMDLYIESHKTSEKDKRTLYEHQIEVFEVFRDFLEKGNKEGYIKLPTGTGKTALFIEFLKATDLKSLIVLPTNQLLDQTIDSLAKFAPGKKFSVINMDEKDYSEKLGLTTYASLRSQTAKGAMKPEDYDCLILDEAHMAMGDDTKRALSAFPGALKIGFTATPQRTKDISVADILKNEIYSMPVQEAVDKKLLCKPMPIVLKIPEEKIDLSNVKMTAEGDYSEKDLEKIFRQKETQGVLNKIALAAWKKNFTDKTGIAYCVGVEHAESLAEAFNKEGVSAIAVSGKTDRDELKIILEDYKAGKYQVICNADLLIQGFDEPKASVCLNLRPTMSAVNAEQRGGRVLRLNEDEPYKIGYIVDFLYKTKQGKNHPILYQEVLGGTAVERARANQATIHKSPEADKEKPKIIVDGIEIPEIDDLVEIGDLIKEIKENSKAGREWHTEERLLKELGDKFREVNAPKTDKLLAMEREFDISIVNSFRTIHPEWFEVLAGRDRGNTKREHFYKDLSEAIIEDYRSTENWINRNELALKTRISPELIYEAEKKVMGNYKPARIGGDLYIPGIKLTVREGSESKVFYPPSIAEKLVEELIKSGKLIIEKPAREIIESIPPETSSERLLDSKKTEAIQPQGESDENKNWRSIGTLVRDLNSEGVKIGKKEIRLFLNRLHKIHPRWFSYKKQGREDMEQYSQDVFDEIKSYIRK